MVIISYIYHSLLLHTSLETDTGDLELLLASGNVFGASLCVKIDTVSLNISISVWITGIYTNANRFLQIEEKYFNTRA